MNPWIRLYQQEVCNLLSAQSTALVINITLVNYIDDFALKFHLFITSPFPITEKGQRTEKKLYIHYTESVLGKRIAVSELWLLLKRRV